MKSTKFRLAYLIIPFVIFVAKAIEFYLYQTYEIDSTSDNQFLSNFIEWFGVIYGLLLPLIMVKVWEQLDSIDREFDKEADAVKALYENIFFLEGKCANIGKDIAPLLRNYVVHVIANYSEELKISEEDFQHQTKRNLPKEISDQHSKRKRNFIEIIITKLGASMRFFAPILRKLPLGWYKIKKPTSNVVESKDTSDLDEKTQGDKLLENIRRKFRYFFLPNVITTRSSEILVEEMFHRLNEIIDIRGDRIGLASQRLFETLRVVALITSITFLLPFYFVGFTPETQLLDEIFIVGITLLVIFIYLIIEDLDEPFEGIWKIETVAWKLLLVEMDSSERQIELEKLAKNKTRGSKLGNSDAERMAAIKQPNNIHKKRSTAAKKKKFS